jgi:hypothetical protein
MGAKGEGFAKQFEAKAQEVTSTVERISDADWKKVTASETWPVGVVAHHIAAGYTKAMGWIDLLRRGEPVPGEPGTHDEGNADHAAKFGSTSKAQTLADLEANAATFRAYLAEIRADELPNEAVHGPAGGVVISVERMVRATAGHPRLHLEHMREAVAADADVAS